MCVVLVLTYCSVVITIVYDKLCSSGGRTPCIYSLAKIHKDGVPLHPIVSFTQCPHTSFRGICLTCFHHCLENHLQQFEIQKSLQSLSGHNNKNACGSVAYFSLHSILHSGRSWIRLGTICVGSCTQLPDLLRLKLPSDIRLARSITNHRLSLLQAT